MVKSSVDTFDKNRAALLQASPNYFKEIIHKKVYFVLFYFTFLFLFVIIIVVIYCCFRPKN